MPVARLANGRRAPRREPLPPEAGAGEPVLRGLTGPWANKTYPLKGKLLVGRAAARRGRCCEDDSVSRKHAEVERNPAGRGAARPGQRQRHARSTASRLGQEPVELNSGDIIQFGMVEVVYESGDEGANVPVRRHRSGARPRRQGPGQGRSERRSASRQEEKLFVVAGAAVALLLAAGVVKQLTTPPRPPPMDPGADGPEVAAENSRRRSRRC